MFDFKNKTDTKSIIVGLDASRCRSGGAINHLIGIISNGNPQSYGINEIHIWTYKSLIGKLPNYSWLIKHTHHFFRGIYI